MGNIKKRGYGEWSLSTIYKILRDPAYYQGYIEYYRDSDEYEPLQVTLPPLITEDTWNEAQRLLNNGKRTSPRNAKYDYLCRGMLHCACGASSHTKHIERKGWKPQDRYICGRSLSGDHYAETKCNAVFKGYAADTLDTKVWAWIIDLVEHPHLLREYLENAQKLQQAHNAPIIARIDQIEQSRIRQGQKVDRLVDMYAGDTSPDVKALFARLKAETESLFNELRSEEDDLRSQLHTTTISDEFIKSWDRHAGKIRGKVAEFSFDDRRKSLESLGFAGRFDYDHSTGEKILWVYLYDTYADKIVLATDSLTATKSGLESSIRSPHT